MPPTDDSSEISRPPAGIRRRSFLVNLGAGTLALLSGPTISLRSLRAATAAAASGSRPIGFVVFGDFGAGNYVLDSHNNPVPTDSPNPNALAVADAVKALMPPNSGGYIVSVGDQTYIPYSHQPTPTPTPTPAPTPDGSCDCPAPSDDEKFTPATAVGAYDEAIGQFYAAYILFPQGSVSQFKNDGASEMNFYAVLGDHDWWHQPRTLVDAPCYPMDCAAYDAANPNFPPQVAPLNQYAIGSITGAENTDQFSGYMQYFENQGTGSSSGNNRYFDLVRGDIHWFALSSDANEVLLGTLSNAFYFPAGGATLPNGLTFGQDNLQNSLQGQWFTSTVAASTSRWRFITTHYPPYSSSSNEDHLEGHPSATYMQWGFENFGIDAVFSGHVHAYERLYVNGVMYVVSGAGGTFESLAGFTNPPLPQSLERVAGQYGFLAAEERPGVMLFNYLVVQTPAGDAAEYSVKDRFVLLKQGTLTSASEIQSQNSILVTSGGGTLAPDADLYLTSPPLSTGPLLGTGPLVLAGKSSIALSTQNTGFTGSLQVHRATLKLRAGRNTLKSTVDVTLAGGTLDVRNQSQAFSTPLEVANGGSIVANPKTRLQFATSRKAKWSGLLIIEGNPGAKSLRFGTNKRGLTSSQLSMIRFRSKRGPGAVLDARGYLTEAK